jgi:hypothetical protein
MFGTTHFGSDHFAGEHFYAGGEVLSGTVRAYWEFGGKVFANRTLDYWIIDALNVVIASGTATTDQSGWMSGTAPTRYSGQRVLMVVNNLDTDMDVSGKVRGQQVVVVT